MSRELAIAAGRAAAEKGMTDACTITRPGSGEPTFDPETGQYDEPERVTVYMGSCRVQYVDSPPTHPDTQTRRPVVRGSELQLPVEISTNVAVNDIAVITASQYDPDLVGRKYTVGDDPAKSHATARRLPITSLEG